MSKIDWHPGMIGVPRPDTGPSVGDVIVGVIVVIIILVIVF